jgi:uncharacterized membrane protein
VTSELPREAEVHGTTATGLTPRAAAVLAYSAWWLSGALFLVIEPSNAYVRFHARQAVYVLGGLWLAGLLFWIFSFAAVFLSHAIFSVSAILAQLTWLVAVVVWGVCLVQAWRGNWWAVPGMRGGTASGDRNAGNGASLDM